MIWIERLCSPRSFLHGERVSIDAPAPTITASGISGSGNYSDWWVLRDQLVETAPKIDPAQPPYRVMSMREIDAMPHNGLDIVSTFSGCGGSCLGFRMAGYRALIACEFVEAARDTYRANNPHTLIDPRDVREITGAEILDAIGKDIGEIDVLEGSPPCSPFSTAGKRHEGWGKENIYSDTVQRADDLFFEYARLVDELRPKVFVAENVSGLVKGSAKGYFKMILRALRDRGYRVEARLLNAQWLGVPQARERLIFVGVREDMKRDPVFPKPLPYRYTIRQAVPDMGADDLGWQLAEHVPSAERITTRTPVHKRKLREIELKRLASFPDDFELTGTMIQRWERIGRSVPPRMMHAVASTIAREVFDARD